MLGCGRWVYIGEDEMARWVAVAASSKNIFMFTYQQAVDTHYSTSLYPSIEDVTDYV